MQMSARHSPSIDVHFEPSAATSLHCDWQSVGIVPKPGMVWAETPRAAISYRTEWSLPRAERTMRDLNMVRGGRECKKLGCYCSP